jgi:hypothetical protein
MLLSCGVAINAGSPAYSAQEVATDATTIEDSNRSSDPGIHTASGSLRAAFAVTERTLDVPVLTSDSPIPDTDD